MEVLPPLSRQIATRWDRMYLLGEQPDYEPPPERSIAAMAQRDGVTPAEYCYDYFIGGDGSRMVYFPVTNYVHGDLEVVREMIEDPHTILGLSDGGAHCGVICDASLNTSMLSHWVRDRTRGPRMPLERTIQRMTERDGGFLRLQGPRPAAAGQEGRRERDRLRRPHLHSPEDDLRPAGRRPPPGPERRRLRHDDLLRHADLREGPGDRRPPRQAGALDGVIVIPLT